MTAVADVKVILTFSAPCSRHGRSVIFHRSPLGFTAVPPHVNHDLMTDFAVEVPAEREDDLTSFEAPADEPRSIPPDRADAPVSEVTERFLRAVIAKVPLDRIEELHLFAPLRQGGIETGIAVVAARAPVVVAVAAPEALQVESELGEHIPEEHVVEEHVHNEHVQDEHVQDEHVHDEHVDEDLSPYADASGEDSAPAPVALDGEATADAIDDLPPAPRIRHTVYTARYRLVLKGPERGRWEADVVDEADAPLLTVETVVRGVQRRAGEETEIVRYSERQIARALRMEWPVITDVPAA